jgi:dihydrofolate reductase
MLATRGGRQTPRRSVIAAVARNGVIGVGGRLPWHLPADLKRFRVLTMGHHIIMGRRTYASIGRALPGRTSIILTRDPLFSAPGCLIAGSLKDAMGLAADDDEVFCIGGAEVYRLALPCAQRLYLTRVETDYPGDTLFPEPSLAEWTLAQEEAHAPNEQFPHAYRFLVYDRKV